MAWWNYSCSGCDYWQHLNPLGETFYWSEETGEIPLWRSYAWCQKCKMVTRAEVLVPREEVQARYAATRNRRARREFEGYLKFLEQRQSLPRCLNCGSTEIIYASPDESLVHPACGGILSISLSPVRGRPKVISHFYTFEGEFLESVEYGQG